ncbi:hypothetical protein HWV62_33221 [Athelia sp. TMB]|nr:hypothetical protein HWV62_33221 [Athelia sp. TMB]
MPARYREPTGLAGPPRGNLFLMFPDIPPSCGGTFRRCAPAEERADGGATSAIADGTPPARAGTGSGSFDVDAAVPSVRGRSCSCGHLGAALGSMPGAREARVAGGGRRPAPRSPRRARGAAPAISGHTVLKQHRLHS